MPDYDFEIETDFGNKFIVFKILVFFFIHNLPSVYKIKYDLCHKDGEVVFVLILLDVFFYDFVSFIYTRFLIFMNEGTLHGHDSLPFFL